MENPGVTSTNTSPKKPRLPKTPGRYLRKLREEKSMAQGELAELLGYTSHQIVSLWEMGKLKIDSTKLPLIHKALALNEVQIERLNYLRFPFLAPDPALWQKKYLTKDADKQAGLLLKAYRERIPKNQSDVGADIGVSHLVVSSWESARSAISCNKLPLLQKSLTLSHEEMLRFITLINPKLPAPWIEKKLQAGAFEHIAFPALDGDWLKSQPKDLQAGLLLKDFRERKEVSRETLAKTLGISLSRIYALETNDKYLLDPAKLPILQKTLALTDKEMTYLQDAMRRNTLARRGNAQDGRG